MKKAVIFGFLIFCFSCDVALPPLTPPTILLTFPRSVFHSARSGVWANLCGSARVFALTILKGPLELIANSSGMLLVLVIRKFSSMESDSSFVSL